MHGGRRAGAGRKGGVPSKVTQAIREEALVESNGKTPLKVMMRVMGKLLEAADAMQRSGREKVVVNQKTVTRLGLLERAADVAHKAAPYLHPRLQAIEVSSQGMDPVKHTVRVIIVKPDGTREKLTEADRAGTDNGVRGGRDR